MKFLTLIRHGSAVNGSSFRDFDRPLTPGGVKKIRFNTGLLNLRGYAPDLIISSPAKRAVQSAQTCAGVLGSVYDIDNIVCINSLYLPTPGDLLDCIRAVEDRCTELFIFSHNNGISWAAQEFSGDSSIIMPAGSVVRTELNIDSWSKAVFGCGRLIDFIP